MAGATWMIISTYLGHWVLVVERTYVCEDVDAIVGVYGGSCWRERFCHVGYFLLQVVVTGRSLSD